MPNARTRIEQAVTEMFNHDRAFYEHLKLLPEEFQEWIDYPSNADTAIRLLGVPEDNWEGLTTQEEVAEASLTKVLVAWDGLYDLWYDGAETAEVFIEVCRKWICEIVEEQEVMGGKLKHNI